MRPKAGAAVVCAPSPLEARALRAGSCTPVLRTGTGPRRASRAAASLPLCGYDAAAVAGIAGALDPRLETADVVVADSVVDAARSRPERQLPAAEVLAGQLRRLGLRVRTGPVVSAGHVVTGRERGRLARDGALTVDMESAWLLPEGLPGAVVRVVADVAGEPLLRPATLRRLRVACRTLARVGPALDAWAGAVGPRRVLLAEADDPEQALASVAAEVDLVLVVGPPDRSDRVGVVEAAQRRGTDAHLVADTGDLDLRWLHGARRVGVTAGASAPPPLVERVVSTLSALGPAEVSTRRTTTQNVPTLPMEVRTA